jgi:hypothetical protein
MLIPQPELKEKIDNFVKEKLNELKKKDEDKM